MIIMGYLYDIYDIEDLSNSYKNGEISRQELINTLINVCELSESISGIMEALKAISEVANGDTNIFDHFVSFAISDENRRVRLTAARILIQNYPKISFKTISYIVEKTTLLKDALGLHEVIISEARSLENEYRKKYKNIADNLEEKLQKSMGRSLEILRLHYT